jgi:hypothetical protein
VIRSAVLTVVAIVLLTDVGSAQPARGWRKVPEVTLVAAANDPRLRDAHAAIEFWNRTFAEIGTPFRLGTVVVVSERVPDRDLADMSLGVLGGQRLDFPESVANLPGDLVVVLSDGDFVSFAARARSRPRVVIGIRTDRTRPLSLPNVHRNVIAHELGHAIGLGHNGDPTKLMCGRPAPCRPDSFTATPEYFFPLTDDEKAFLRSLYPPTWAPGG